MVHDDGGIISSADNLVAIWNMVEESPKLGLQLNPAKCEWSWLDSRCTKPCPIHVQGGSSSNGRDPNMLGVPLGSNEKVAAYTEKKLLGKLKSMVDRLADFDTVSFFSSSYLIQ